MLDRDPFVIDDDAFVCDAVTLAMSGHTFEIDRDPFVINHHPFIITAVTLAMNEVLYKCDRLT